MTPANDNTPAARPAEFDARIVDYVPGLRRLANKLGYFNDEADYLVTDTVVHCMEHWQRFREDGGFWGFVSWQMRNIARNRRPAQKRRRMFVEDPRGLAAERMCIAPVQEHVVDLKRVMGRLSDRGGDVLLRRASGELLSEIGADLGVSRERIRQIEDVTRARLIAGMEPRHAA